MGMSFSITGISETMAKIQSDKDHIVSAMVSTMDKIGLFMEREVKASIAGQRDEHPSVDTGRFLNSVSSSTSQEISSHALQAVIYTEVDYAKYLEYGTSSISPRAHFSNSLARNRSEVQSMMKEEVEHAV